MQQIYLDNGATSHPKAPGLGAAVAHYLDHVGANLNRGSYKSATETAMQALLAREYLCQLFGFRDSSHVVFTAGITHSLNQIIKGTLKPGDHCIITSMEHNAVLRPVIQMTKLGIELDIAPCDSQGRLIIDRIEPLIKKNTKMAIMIHGSNVCGTVNDIEQAAKIFAKHQVMVVLDCAQTAGHIPIHFEQLGLSALTFTGHKGLLGPAGIGGMLLSSQLAEQMTPLIAGGTGSVSDSEEMPIYMPDKFEAGTLNIPGIFGLAHSVKYLLDTGVDHIQQQEQELTERFLEKVVQLSNISLCGQLGVENRVGVVSLSIQHKDNSEIAYRLERDYGIMTRCGLHCAPLAHQTLGTYPTGTIRFSFSHFNTNQDIDQAVNGLYQLTK